jgi:3',5'-cyclic AMP phosphodiesterase CpdA
VVHTGDVSHLSRPEEFGQAKELLSEIKVGHRHVVPGEHDALDEGLSGYLEQFDHDGKNRPYFSFDQNGAHFIGLSNVLNFTAKTLSSFGNEQIAWLKSDLKGVSHSTPVVVMAHIPMWTVYEPWGWGTADADAALALLKPFGSVTVLNGHIHQVLQKVEGNVALHTAMSLAYPLPTPGQPGFGEPGPVTVPAGQLGRLLGTRQVRVVRGKHALATIDTPIDS